MANYYEVMRFNVNGIQIGNTRSFYRVGDFNEWVRELKMFVNNNYKDGETMGIYDKNMNCVKTISKRGY